MKLEEEANLNIVAKFVEKGKVEEVEKLLKNSGSANEVIDVVDVDMNVTSALCSKRFML